MTAAIKECIARVATRCGVKLISLKKHGQPKPDMGEEFAAFFSACQPYSLLHVERLYSLYRATQYVVKRSISGSFVECGVWKGGAAMMIMKTLLSLGETKRHIYLYDTYSGMTQPTQDDGSVIPGKESVHSIWKRNQHEQHNAWCYSPVEDVRKAVESTGYPMDFIHFVKGRVEDTVPHTLPGEIALLRLDTDWYQSTKHELEHLYPLLREQGVLILDDYGYWSGARKAADEYFSSHSIHLLLHRDDESGVIGLKH